ncbi:MAG: hypothetical protein QXM53_07305, partial [Thermofilaceae archaeon]
PPVGLIAVDALYLKTALEAGTILVSLDGKDFVYRARRNPPIEVCHVSRFPTNPNCSRASSTFAL